MIAKEAETNPKGFTGIKRRQYPISKARLIFAE